MKKRVKKRSIDYSRFYPLFFTIIFVVILFQYSFSSLEAIFYDFRIKHDWGIGFRDNIVLVTMDEESDEFLGERYPYTYATHERLFSKLLKDRPTIVNYFVNLLEPESQTDIENFKKFKDSIYNFKNSGGHFRFGTDMDHWGEQLPPKELREFGYSLSLINVDSSIFAKDDISRRMILNISGFESLHLWTANTFREQHLTESKLDDNAILGSYYSREADATFTLYRYYTSPRPENGMIRKIPFHRVVVGNFPKGFFADKIVLVGPSYISRTSDYLLTPYNREEYKASRLVAHAEMIQSLISNKTIYQIPKSFSYVLAVIIAFFLSLTISKVKPTYGLLISFLLLPLGIMFFSHILFSLFGLWLYTIHLIITVVGVYYVWVPFRAIAEYQRRFAIQEEAKIVKKVENLKQNFISLMSHDLKTPVAKIAGLADVLLQKHRQDGGLKRDLTSIIDSTKELNGFITSILDLTKIESKNLNLSTSSKDINPIIESIVDGLKYATEKKKIELELELSPLYPIQIDVKLIERVVSNLVENAIKYSGENSRIIVKTTDDDDWVYVEISDNGVGIPKSDLDHIFDKFYRVKNDASHSIKGTGLGLYLVKYFVELHGGTISAVSIVGEGTTFRIKLRNE